MKTFGSLMVVAALEAMGCSGENRNDKSPGKSPEASQSATATTTATASATEAASPQASAEPTETVAPEPEGSRGVESIDLLELDDNVKLAIKELIGDAELQIATQELVVAIEPALKTRSKNPLTSVRLNIETYGEEVHQRIKQARINMSKLGKATQSKKYFLTDEEVSSALNSADSSFQIRAKDPATKKHRLVSVSPGSLRFPLVVVHKATNEGMSVVYSTGIALEHLEKNGVLGLE